MVADFVKMTGKSEAEAIADLTRGVPMKRVAEVDEVVEVILFAADPKNSFMTGHALAVDGGIAARMRGSRPPNRRPGEGSRMDRSCKTRSPYQQDVGQRPDRFHRRPLGRGVGAGAVRPEHHAGNAGFLEDRAVGPERLAAPCRLSAERLGSDAVERRDDRLGLRHLEWPAVQAELDDGVEIRVLRRRSRR